MQKKKKENENELNFGIRQYYKGIKHKEEMSRYIE